MSNHIQEVNKTHPGSLFSACNYTKLRKMALTYGHHIKMMGSRSNLIL
jgi:hypothetical protein